MNQHIEQECLCGGGGKIMPAIVVCRGVAEQAGWIVSCDFCGALTEVYKTAHAAREAWLARDCPRTVGFVE